MLVYGDPSRDVRLEDLRAEVVSLARQLPPLGENNTARLDALRNLLIRAGELEQAVEDAGQIPDSFLVACRAVNDTVAAEFVSAYGGARGGGALGQIISELLTSAPAPSRTVRVKTPEGFAFYTLFPEQYVDAARTWFARHADVCGHASILIVGVRSIGTSLSAVVRETLYATGWQARRITVRPAGHPFDRRVDLSTEQLGGSRFVIVVDEGPGASGSSMAAVARAAVVAGIEPGHVALFPSHPGEPGSHASDDVRAWWRTTPRYITALGELRWGGRSLIEELSLRTSRLFDGLPVASVEDLSGGQWRQVVNQPSAPAFPAFERTKYRCALSDGRAVLWKFAGLDGGAARASQAMRARATWTPSPIDSAFGFVATRWIEGQTLTPEDATNERIPRIGAYIRAAGVPVLSPEEQADGIARLSEMLYWNVRQSLGEASADAARTLAQAAGRLRDRQPAARYGDGRLGPYEWIETSPGELMKVDCVGHDADHTLLGPQPIAWDLAGAIVEWRLDAARTEMLQSAAGLSEIPRELVRFYRAAYAAFRVGMAWTSGDEGPCFREQLAREIGP